MNRREFFKRTAATAGAIALAKVPMPTVAAEVIAKPLRTLGVPDGWLPCDGRAISPTQFPELAALLSENLCDTLPDTRARTMLSDSRFATHAEALSFRSIIRAKPGGGAVPVGAMVFWQGEIQ